MSRILWFYGISGSGKTTAAEYAESFMTHSGEQTVHIDADDVRAHLWPEVNLGHHGRVVNVDRIVHLCEMIMSANVSVVVSASAPFEEQRVKALEDIPDIKFIHVSTPLDICKKRKPHVYGNSFSVEKADDYPPPYAVISGVLKLEAMQKQIEQLLI